MIRKAKLWKIIKIYGVQVAIKLHFLGDPVSFLKFVPKVYMHALNTMLYNALRLIQNEVLNISIVI